MKTNGRLLISKVEIMNMRSIEYLEYDADIYNDISGANEVGKTTFQDVIAWALRKELTKGGDWLRHGADKGSVKLTYTDESWILSWIDKDGKVGREHSSKGKQGLNDYVKGLTNIFFLNPEAFRVASDKDRLTILCDILPLNLDWGVLEGIVGYKVAKTNDPLGAIQAQYDKIFSERAGSKSFAEDRERTYREMRRNLPAEKPEPPANLDLYESQKKDQDEILDSEKKQIEKTAKETAKKYLDVRDAANVEAKRIYDEAMAAAQSEYEQALARGSDWEKKAIADAQQAYNVAVEPINKKLGEIQEYIKNYDILCANWEFAEEKRIDGEALRKEESDFSEQLKQLLLLKKTLIKTFPIPGVDIVDGKIYLENAEGIMTPFDACSDSQQKMFMGTIAKFKAMENELPMIRMDKMEAVSESKRELLKQGAFKSGVQHWVSRFVENQPLTIIGYGPDGE